MVIGINDSIASLLNKLIACHRLLFSQTLKVTTYTQTRSLENALHDMIKIWQVKWWFLQIIDSREFFILKPSKSARWSKKIFLQS